MSISSLHLCLPHGHFISDVPVILCVHFWSLLCLLKPTSHSSLLYLITLAILMLKACSVKVGVIHYLIIFELIPPFHILSRITLYYV
jgi:hypothetical protein